MTTTTAVEPQSPESTTARVRCLCCEYDLRGQPRATGHCPECGMRVEPSWQRHEAEVATGLPPLQLSPTGWLRAMGWACCTMLLSGLLTGVESLRIIPSSKGDDSLSIVGVAVGLLQLAVVPVSLWLFSTREPLAPRHRRGGAGGGRAALIAVRVAAGLFLVLPFAAVAASNRFAGALALYSKLSVVSAVLAGLATWVVMRRLAAGARRAGRPRLALADTCFAWAAPVVWVAHSVFNPSMPYDERSEWLLNAHPILGFVESAFTLPRSLVLAPRWSGGVWPLLPWVPEALLSVAGIVLLAVAARAFFAAAARSPRAAAREA